MTREDAIAFLQGRIDLIDKYYPQIEDYREALDMAIKLLEQEPCDDEIILTKEEYGQLLSNEFDNGYAKGYREALEQEPILDKLRAEIQKLRGCSCSCSDGIIDDVEDILDKLIES